MSLMQLDTIRGLGLTDVSVTLADLLRILKNPQTQNIPLTADGLSKIKHVIGAAGRTNPIVRDLLEQMK